MSVDQKLFAEWFWTDRWTGSSAFGLPIEARGVYREMLTQAWRRGAKLPSDHRAIQRLTGIMPDEWERCWPLVRVYWRISGEFLVNDTQLEIYKRALDTVQTNHDKAVKGATARWDRKDAQASAQASAQAVPEDMPEECPLSLSLSLSPEQSPDSGILGFVRMGWPEGLLCTTSEKAAPSAPSPVLRKPKTNIGVITKLAHIAIQAQTTQTDFASLKDDIKTQCTLKHIAYDAELVGKALESALASRRV